MAPQVSRLSNSASERLRSAYQPLAHTHLVQQGNQIGRRRHLLHGSVGGGGASRSIARAPPPCRHAARAAAHAGGRHDRGGHLRFHGTRSGFHCTRWGWGFR